MGKNDTVITDEGVRGWLPTRKFGTHKWEVGGLAIVAGAPNYVGAPLLCATAAARAGAGVVMLAVPRSIVGPIATRLPEAIFLPIPESDPQAFATKARELLLERFEKTHALVIGPGIGQDQHATSLMAAFFGKTGASRSTSIGFFNESRQSTEGDDSALIAGGDKPTVIDADALNWLSGQSDWWANCKPNSLVLTPHVGEMSRLHRFGPERCSFGSYRRSQDRGIEMESSGRPQVWSQYRNRRKHNICRARRAGFARDCGSR